MVLAGDPIYGSGIPPGDTIVGCTSGVITMNTAANATNATAVPLTYNNQFVGTTTNVQQECHRAFGDMRCC